MVYCTKGNGNDDLFIFTNCMLMKVLKPINIIIKQLQSSSENIVSALSVVNAVRDDLKSTREVLEDETCAEMVENYRKSAHITNVQTVQKRNSSIPSSSTNS